MFIKLYSKVNRDHCVASFINFKSIIIRGEKKSNIHPPQPHLMGHAATHSQPSLPMAPTIPIPSSFPPNQSPWPRRSPYPSPYPRCAAPHRGNRLVEAKAQHQRSSLRLSKRSIVQLCVELVPSPGPCCSAIAITRPRIYLFGMEPPTA